MRAKPVKLRSASVLRSVIHIRPSRISSEPCSRGGVVKTFEELTGLTPVEDTGVNGALPISGADALNEVELATGGGGAGLFGATDAGAPAALETVQFLVEARFAISAGASGDRSFVMLPFKAHPRDPTKAVSLVSSWLSAGFTCRPCRSVRSTLLLESNSQPRVPTAVTKSIVSALNCRPWYF